MREHLMEDIRERLPGFEPRNDFDLWLVGFDYRGPNKDAEIHAYVDKELARLRERKEEGLVLKEATKSLNSFIEITGVCASLRAESEQSEHSPPVQVKPKKGQTNPHVFVRATPDSEYSIRLFPGAFATKEYCLDFVRSDTGEPVNSPFAFELWAVPASPLDLVPPMKLKSLENAFSGLGGGKPKPGAEKFVMRDGMTCVLRRPGLKNVKFKVPVRVEKADTSNSNEIVLEFPAEIRV